MWGYPESDKKQYLSNRNKVPLHPLLSKLEVAVAMKMTQLLLTKLLLVVVLLAGYIILVHGKQMAKGKFRIFVGSMM